MIELGIKSDPIEYRYSFTWLFDLLEEAELKTIQLGSFFELYSLPDDYFLALRDEADRRGMRFKSVFTAHRELGGFFVNNPHMERVARRNFEQLINVAALIGADYCGSNPGAVYRDQAENKDKGIETYLRHMKELSALAKERGLKALTMEPMSCLAEPPTTPAEMDYMVGTLNAYHAANAATTVPTYLCGDISHGLADANRQVVYSNMALFEHGIPMMNEFHFKNTDALFNSTFGFSEAERARGIVDLAQVRGIVEQNLDRFPVRDVVGYLEIGGPKTGRDYSDPLLRNALLESLTAIKAVFNPS
jgi:sugar phosphate isomerase/epimerase